MSDLNSKPHNNSDETIQRLVKERLLKDNFNPKARLDPAGLTEAIKKQMQESRQDPDKVKNERISRQALTGMTLGSAINFPTGALVGAVGGAGLGLFNNHTRGDRDIKDETSLKPRGLTKRVDEALKKTDQDTPFQTEKALATGLGAHGLATLGQWPIHKAVNIGMNKNLAGLGPMSDDTLLELLNAHNLSPQVHNRSGAHEYTPDLDLKGKDAPYAMTDQVNVRRPTTNKPSGFMADDNAFFDPKGEELQQSIDDRAKVKEHGGRAKPHLGSIEGNSKNVFKPGIISHELGHADIHREKSLTGFLQRNLYSKTHHPAYGILPATATAYATKDDDNVGVGAGKGALIGAVGHSPSLIPEFEASRRGIKALYQTSLSSKVKGRNALSLALPFATYMLGSVGTNAAVGGLNAYLNKRKHPSQEQVKHAFDMGVLRRASEIIGEPIEKLADTEWNPEVGAWYNPDTNRYFNDEQQHLNPYTRQPYQWSDANTQFTGRGVGDTAQFAGDLGSLGQGVGRLAQRGMNLLRGGSATLPAAGKLFSKYIPEAGTAWNTAEAYNSAMHGNDLGAEGASQLNSNILPNGKNWGAIGNAVQSLANPVGTAAAPFSMVQDVMKENGAFRPAIDPNSTWNTVKNLGTDFMRATTAVPAMMLGTATGHPELYSQQVRDATAGADAASNDFQQRLQRQTLATRAPGPQRPLGTPPPSKPIQPPQMSANGGNVVQPPPAIVPKPIKPNVNTTVAQNNTPFFKQPKGTGSTKNPFPNPFPSSSQLAGVKPGFKLNTGFPKLKLALNLAPLADDAVSVLANHLMTRPATPPPQEEKKPIEPIAPKVAIANCMAPPKLDFRSVLKKYCPIQHPNHHLVSHDLKKYPSTNHVARSLMGVPKTAGIWDFSWKEIWEALMGTKRPVDANVNIARKRVISSNIRSIGYDPNSKTMEVEFNNKTRYRYPNVKTWQWKDFQQAESKGKFFNRVFKPEQDFRKMAHMRQWMILKTALAATGGAKPPTIGSGGANYGSMSNPSIGPSSSPRVITGNNPHSTGQFGPALSGGGAQPVSAMSYGANGNVTGNMMRSPAQSTAPRAAMNNSHNTAKFGPALSGGGNSPISAMSYGANGNVTGHMTGNSIASVMPQMPQPGAPIQRMATNHMKPTLGTGMLGAR